MSNLNIRSITGKDGRPVMFPTGISIGTGAPGGVNNIGTPGQQGFGIGVCPGPLPSGMGAIFGCTDPSSDNYGNYQYSDGSVMVWIPAFFYKWGTGANGLAMNAVDIKPFSAYADVATANAAGYALHRAFYDGGVREGFFIDKYLCSNNGGIFSSIKNGIPCDTNGSQSGVGAINGVGANNYGMVQQAAKSRGSTFHSASIFMHKALAMLSYAHAQASTSTTYCAWYHTTNNFPKGCNNDALGDTNDAALVFTTAGHGTYPNKPRTGSANLFARTAHNGQNSGVVDLNGAMWEVAFGLTHDGTNYYGLKTTKRLRDLTGSNATGADSFFGATGIAANYDSLGTTIGGLQGNSTVKTFGSTSQVLSEATSGNNWTLAGIGVPINTGGTNIFGNDGIWDYKNNEMCPIVGADWSNGSLAGVWALNLNNVRSNASTNVGGRAALYL
jgi:hypothetical protein